MDDAMMNKLIDDVSRQIAGVCVHQSIDYLEQMTLKEYKEMAKNDVDHVAKLLTSLNEIMKKRSDYLSKKISLNQQRCRIFAEIDSLQGELKKSLEETEKVNKDLKNGNFSQFKTKNINKIMENQNNIAKVDKDVETRIEQPLVEPTYSTRSARNEPQSSERFELNMQPPVYSTRKNDSKCNSLDFSLLNDNADLTICDDIKINRQLKFDELDDEEEDIIVPNNRKIFESVTNKPKSPIKPIQKPEPINLTTLPPPPVYTSSFGKTFNK